MMMYIIPMTQSTYRRRVRDTGDKVTIAYHVIAPAAAASARYLDILSDTRDICPRAHLHFTAPDQSCPALAPAPLSGP